MTDLTSIPACRAFAENVLEQLHGAEVEAVETLAKARRGCFRVDVRFDSHITAGTRPFLELILQCFPSASILHSTSNPSTSTLTASPPLQILSTVHHLNFPLRLGYHKLCLVISARSPHKELPPLLQSTCSMLGGRGALLRVLCLISGFQ